jgi:hypothetical protein
VILCLGNIILCATALAVLLVFSGMEKNPGPGVKCEKILQVWAAGAIEIGKSM